MKKHLAIAALALGLAFSAAALAADAIKGTLVKIDGAFYVVKDKNGKEHRGHWDGSTKKSGDIKEGDSVTMHVSNGHVVEIEVRPPN